MDVLTVLKSDGMKPVVEAIREKQPVLAEFLLMEIEADHTATMSEYTADENRYIDAAIEELWKQTERLWDEMHLLKRRPYDGKHSVADGDMPEPGFQLSIYCAPNEDSVGGGAATLGADGKWYWTYDYRLDIECKYQVTHWQYL